jgi:diguanylate cyclase (GGDEF)-like protein/PAS domain S-box-containing protein
MTLKKNTKTLLRYITVGMAMVAILIVLMTITLSKLRQEAIQTHRHVANLHAYTFAEHFSQILEQTGFAMDRLALLSDGKTDTNTLAPLMIEFLHNAPYLRSLSLLDTKGQILASSFEQNIAHHVAFDRFLPIPFADNALLRIGVPWQGRDFASGTPSTPQAPVDADRLSFLPLIKKVFFNKQPYYVAASINMDYLNNRYSTILPLEQGSVLLWRIDGTLLFSTDPRQKTGISHYNAAHVGNQTDFYDHAIADQHSPLDVFRVAHLFPFVVEVKTNEDNALGYWDKERQKVLWISATFLLLSGILALTLVMRYMRELERQKQQIAYEKRFHIAMEATQTGLWTWDLSTNEVTWDPQCFILLGYQPNAFEVSLEKIYAMTHPDESSKMFFTIKEQIIAHHGFVIERRMRNAQNEWVWIQVRGKVIEYTREGEPKLLTGVYINIDAQKKAETLHLSAVAFEAQEAILITDANEKILKVNEAFTRITGYEDSEILGKTPRILSSGKHDKAFYAAMWHDLLNKGFWQGEMWNKRKNGEIYAEFLTVTAIRNAQGKITHYIANFNDITYHKAAQEEIKEMAYYDALTHLGNRRLLDQTMSKLCSDHAHRRQFNALIFIDLDYFKELNDRYGHNAGDMLLVQAAARLQDATRKSDLVVRLGGDEFVIVLVQLGFQKGFAQHLTQTIVQKILTLLCEPYSLTHGNYTLGASIGYTLFQGDTTQKEAALLKEADQAMYCAKSRGRNQIQFYDMCTEEERRTQEP